MRAASVRPHAGKRDLLISPPLQQELSVARSEQKHAESSVQEIMWRVDVFHQMACRAVLSA